MNIFKIVILGSLLFVSSSAIADSFGGKFTYSDDTEGNTSLSVGSEYKWNNGYGVRYSTTNYRTVSKNNVSNTVSLSLDKKLDEYSINGDVGVGYIGNTTYFVGDTTLYKPLGKNVSVFAGVNGDIVDGGNGIANTITYTGVNIGIDLYNDNFGLTAAVKQNYFSDHNARTGYLFKAYAEVVDGVSVYATTERLRNTDPTVDYFSPKVYNRHNLGLAIKHKFGNALIVSGHAETGKQDEGGKSETANAYKIQVESAGSSKWQWKILGISDVASNTGYRYYSIIGELTRRF